MKLVYCSQETNFVFVKHLCECTFHPDVLDFLVKKAKLCYEVEVSIIELQFYFFPIQDDCRLHCNYRIMWIWLITIYCTPAALT